MLYLFEMIELQDPFLNRVSYGILEKKLEGCRVLETAYIPGISCDKVFVAQLMERCERNQLDPIYLLDVIMDAIS